MKNTFSFILGRKNLLSIAEILSVLPADSTEILDITPEALTLNSPDATQDPKEFLKILGGTVKIVKNFTSLNLNDHKEAGQTNFRKIFQIIGDKINEYLYIKFKDSDIKNKYGITIYSLSNRDEKNLKLLLINSKKFLKKNNINARFINNNFQNLGNVIIEKEKLLNKGAEICIIIGKDKIFLGETNAISDFESYSDRDYGKPARDSRRGMLPPKVAQMLINFTGINCKKFVKKTNRTETIYDPFCGNGTPLMEGLLMGLNVQGSDVDDESIKATTKNIEWLVEKYPELNKLKYNVFQSDAQNILKEGLENITAIACESCLGPPLSIVPPKNVVDATHRKLSNIYLNFFKNIIKFIPKKFAIVIAVPAYRYKNTYIYIENLIEKIENLGYKFEELIPDEINQKFYLPKNERNSLIYDREDQIVAREILKFTKI